MITDRALAFLDERPKDAPFYLSVHYTAPHGPWGKRENKPEIWELYQNCKFQSVPEEPPIQIKYLLALSERLLKKRGRT